jgi:hypothetical protein
MLRRYVVVPDAGTIGQGSVAAIGMVERSLAWLVGCQELQVHYERRPDLLLGFVYLAGALICPQLAEPAEGGRQAVALRTGL